MGSNDLNSFSLQGPHMRHLASLFFCVALCILSRPYALASIYKQLPVEQKIKICEDLLHKLTPINTRISSQTWISYKLGFAAAIGLIASLVNGYCESKRYAAAAQRARADLNQVYEDMNRLVRTHNLNYSAVELLPTNEPVITIALNHTTTFVFLITTAAVYAASSLLLDNLWLSYRTTLFDFLQQWPDLVSTAPPQFIEEVRTLYGSYLRNRAVNAIPDEHTAKLILLAFTVFLTAEMEGVAQILT
jgi:hypothetical protein